MPTNKRILISGASIAGLTLAHWLAKYGFQPTVIERAPGLRTGGNGVDLRDQAIEVAEQMSIMGQIRAAATDVQGMKFVNAADQSVVRIDTQGDGEVEIMRGDLVTILHQAAGDAVKYIFGDSIKTLKQTGDGVAVTFEHGPARRFDLVIGADGLHSTLRKLAFGPESQFLQHKDHYFAFANTNASLGENRWMTMYNLPGKMAGIYRSDNHTQAKAYFIFRSKEPITYDHRDVKQHKRLISTAFASETSWRVRDLLAGALAAAHGDHEIAFRRYEEGHRTLVEQKQQIGPNLRLMVPKTRTGRWMRDALVRLPLMQIMTAAERLTQSKNSEPLPSYPAPSPAAR